MAGGGRIRKERDWEGEGRTVSTWNGEKRKRRKRREKGEGKERKRGER